MLKKCYIYFCRHRVQVSKSRVIPHIYTIESQFQVSHTRLRLRSLIATLAIVELMVLAS